MTTEENSEKEVNEYEDYEYNVKRNKLWGAERSWTFETERGTITDVVEYYDRFIGRRVVGFRIVDGCDYGLRIVRVPFFYIEELLKLFEIMEKQYKDRVRKENENTDADEKVEDNDNAEDEEMVTSDDFSEESEGEEELMTADDFFGSPTKEDEEEEGEEQEADK